VRDGNKPQIEFEPTAPVRVGLIALATDLTSESDAERLLPGAGIRLHTTRVAFENPTTPDSLRRMEPLLTEAAGLIVPGLPLAAIWYSCTAASAILGDGAVARAVTEGRPGVPLVTPPEAAAAGFAALGVTRVAVLTPYLAETTRGLVDYFEGKGLTVVSTLSLGLADDRDMARVSGASIREAAAEADHPEAEALFISCTALPALAQIGAIEARLGKPVVSSNQASLWRIGELAGCRLDGPGRLFGRMPEAAPA